MSTLPENKKFDAILVAGEGESSYKVYNQHKAFLSINGKCIINYVLEALQQVESINDIYVVGLKDKLAQTVEEGRIDTRFPKRIHIVEQRANLYENIWHTFLQTLRDGAGGAPDIDKPENADKAVLIVPCDSPLITSHEVEYFISQCDMRKHDHIIGLTAEKNLEYFYPRDGLPGIRMAYLHLREKRCRINNLHLVKPVRIENRRYIREMYQYRYQRNIRNIFLFGLSILGKNRHGGFRLFLALQLALFFSTLNLAALAEFFRRRAPKEKVESCISKLMKTRFAGLEVPFPGAALDIDNDKDFEAMKARFDEWRDHLSQLNNKYPLPYRSEFTV
jgi:molybdopterin-guanine dinucleotide biosynthesis protein A